MRVYWGLLGARSQGRAVTDGEMGGASPLWGEGVHTVVIGEVWGGSSWGHEIGTGWFWWGFLNI